MSRGRYDGRVTGVLYGWYVNTRDGPNEKEVYGRTDGGIQGSPQISL